MTGAHVSLLQKDDTQAPVPLQEPIHVLFMLAEYKILNNKQQVLKELNNKKQVLKILNKNNKY